MILLSEIQISSKGDFSKTVSFLKKATNVRKIVKLEKYGERGVEALRAATPKDTGKTADSWDYKITESNGGFSIVWTNSNKLQNTSIALLIQYGHATRSGGYVQGVDYINPALRPVFDEIARDAWREVTS